MMKVVGLMMLVCAIMVQSPKLPKQVYRSCPVDGNYVPKCSRCVYSSQCQEPLKCCPFMKVCIKGGCRKLSNYYAGCTLNEENRYSDQWQGYYENHRHFPNYPQDAGFCTNTKFPREWTSCTTCSSFSGCTGVKVPKVDNADGIICAEEICTAEDCCTSCHAFKCPDGQKRKRGADKKFCTANPCPPAECCKARPPAETKFLQVDNTPARCNVRGEFTPEQKRDALYWHNFARREVAKAGLCSNMLEMIWNDQVAAVASNYVTACNDAGAARTKYEHNENRSTLHPGRQADYSVCSDNKTTGCVQTQGGLYCLGENIAWASGRCIDGISDGVSDACREDCDSENCSFEKRIYGASGQYRKIGWVVGERKGSSTVCKDGSPGGHCVAVQWQNSEQVGCGYDQCPIGNYIGCNYFPPGAQMDPVTNTLKVPCKAGAACTTGDTARCPSTHQFCNDGLCSRVDINTLTCDGAWSATCDGNCQKTYSITTRRTDHITVCPYPHGKKKSCTGGECGAVAAEVIVTFPAIVFADCCSGGAKKKAFLDQCSADNYPAICTGVTKGSAIVTFGGSMEAIKKVKKKADTNTFKAIVVNGISFAVTDAQAKTITTGRVGSSTKPKSSNAFSLKIQTAVLIGMVIFVY